MPELLPEYRVKARNTSTTSENAIHHDDVARRYGFGGGLVPGATVYAYMTHPLVAAFGPAWLDRGVTSVRFVKPIMDGEEVVVTGEITGRTPQAITAQLSASTVASGECAVATATLPAGLPTPVNIVQYGTAALPAERPPATRETLLAISALGTPVAAYDHAAATEYLEKVADPQPIYRGSGGRVHPGFYLDQANKALSRNVRVSPWIHTGSVVRHLAPARVGDTLVTRGRVRSLFEKKGREFVELDVVIVAGDRPRPVAHVLHTAIYRLPAPDAR